MPIIHKRADGSFIIPAELLAGVEVGSMLKLDLSHDFSNVMHFVNHSSTSASQLEVDSMEHEMSEISYRARNTSQDSEIANSSEVEADTGVNHGSRKRKRNPDEWAKNVRKRKADPGEAVRQSFTEKMSAPCRPF